MAENQTPTPDPVVEEQEKPKLVNRIKNKVQNHPRTLGAVLGAAGTVGALAVLVKAAQPGTPASHDVVEGQVISSTDTPLSEA